MIRKLRNDELETVMEIWLKTNIKAHCFIDESYWKGKYNLVKEMLPCAAVFVYKDSNKVQGFVGLKDNYIAGLFVDSESQSKGIGKLLLDYVKENYPGLSLQVYKKNIRAVRFYKREGFTIVKEQIDENTDEIEFVMNWAK